MPRPKKSASSDAQEAPQPSRTSHLFQSRKPPERGGALTRERIAEHMDAFRKAGGAIEVLGTTRSLQRIGQPADASAPVAPATPNKRNR
ncbi:hypothetical protein H9L17_15660 [Thermomonas brevis]|uniref:Uncharacterized protein n=1 Tax=Thermomonas brevis TaxID=215691 RepID=A0A7G9QT97_9GAMM|nr:hypothetical protein [Thermomonas brevis]QNN46572.1 hypothetical protein H9L17_15660 [Thermomonas brevis]